MTFSSIDIHLHTEALLSTMNFLNNLLPTQEANTVEIVQEKEEKKEVLRKFSKAFRYQTLYCFLYFSLISHSGFFKGILKRLFQD